MTKGLLAITKRPEPDNDLEGLKKCVDGIEMTSERMRRATVEYLLDRYVTHPRPKQEKE